LITSSEIDLDEVQDALERVRDPEVGISIVGLGMIYDVSIERNSVCVKISPTSGACPFLIVMMETIKAEVMKTKGVYSVNVEVVWTPPWTPERMSQEMRSRFNQDLSKLADELGIQPKLGASPKP